MLLRQVRILLALFIASLVLIGATTIPLETELRLLAKLVNPEPTQPTDVSLSVVQARDALIDVNERYSFLAYGTDWLAFGHFVIAIAFIGPWRDPVRNIWVVEFGMIACLLVVPYALVMGGWRGIPLGWRLIDCSFGVIGIIPLWYCRRLILRLSSAS